MHFFAEAPLFFAAAASHATAFFAASATISLIVTPSYDVTDTLCYATLDYHFIFRLPLSLDYDAILRH